MSANGIGAAGYQNRTAYQNRVGNQTSAAGFGTKGAEKGAAGKNFGSQLGNVANASKREHIVYIKTDDMLYSGGNGSGLSFYIKYAESSTEEDPTVVAKGVDENGSQFEQTIHINDINPRCATVVEMRALEAYLGVDKKDGFSSLPMDPSAGNMGLYDRANYMNMFDRQIRDMNTLGERKLAAYYRYSMQEYWKFMEEREKSGAYRNAGISALLGQPGGPLQQRLKEQSAGKTTEQPAGKLAGDAAEPPVEQSIGKEPKTDSKADSEIITQPDGSRTLIITNQIGGMKMVTSIELSKPSPFVKEYEKQDLESSAKSPIETKQPENGGTEHGN